MVSVPEFIDEARSRHEGRVERRHDRQEKRHARRVRFGEIVSQADLDSGDAILDDVEPGESPPVDEATEPWAGWKDKIMPASVRARLNGYQASLRRWREEHPDEPTGDEPGEPYSDDSGEEDSGD